MKNLKGIALQESGEYQDMISVLARRAPRCPMDAHFWGKCIPNSPNLLKHLQGTCPLDTQLSIFG